MVKSEVTNLASDCQGQLDGPQAEHGFGAATPYQLDVLVADIVDEFLTQLTWQAGEYP